MYPCRRLWYLLFDLIYVLYYNTYSEQGLRERYSIGWTDALFFEPLEETVFVKEVSAGGNVQNIVLFSLEVLLNILEL